MSNCNDYYDASGVFLTKDFSPYVGKGICQSLYYDWIDKYGEVVPTDCNLTRYFVDVIRPKFSITNEIANKIWCVLRFFDDGNSIDIVQHHYTVILSRDTVYGDEYFLISTMVKAFGFRDDHFDDTKTFFDDFEFCSVAERAKFWFSMLAAYKMGIVSTVIASGRIVSVVCDVPVVDDHTNIAILDFDDGDVINEWALQSLIGEFASREDKWIFLELITLVDRHFSDDQIVDYYFRTQSYCPKGEDVLNLYYDILDALAVKFVSRYVLMFKDVTDAKRFFIKLIRLHVNTSDLVHIYKFMEVMRLEGRVPTIVVPFCLLDVDLNVLGFRYCEDFLVAVHWLQSLHEDDSPIGGFIIDDMGESVNVVVVHGNDAILSDFGFIVDECKKISDMLEYANFSYIGRVYKPGKKKGSSVTILCDRKFDRLCSLRTYNNIDDCYVYGKAAYEKYLSNEIGIRFEGLRPKKMPPIPFTGQIYDGSSVLLSAVVALMLESEIRCDDYGLHFCKPQFYSKRGVFQFILANSDFKPHVIKQTTGFEEWRFGFRYLHSGDFYKKNHSGQFPSCSKCNLDPDIKRGYDMSNIMLFLKDRDLKIVSILDIIEWSLQPRLVKTRQILSRFIYEKCIPLDSDLQFMTDETLFEVSSFMFDVD